MELMISTLTEELLQTQSHQNIVRIYFLLLDLKKPLPSDPFYPKFNKIFSKIDEEVKHIIQTDA